MTRTHWTRVAVCCVAAVLWSVASLDAIAKGKGGGGARSSGGKGGSHSVRGHTTKNGTYVKPHRATNRDGSKSNNWSHKGNTNPNTGKEGTKQ